MPTPNNLYCPRGQHRVYQAIASPTAINVTGQSFAFTVRSGPAPDDPIVFQVTTGGGQITIIDAINGVLQIVLSSATTLVEAGNYFFDLWRTDVGSEDQLAVGLFQVTPSYYQ